MKNKRIYLLFAVTSLFLFEGIGSFAQTVGTSDFTYRRGETIEESVLPATPQAASVSGYFSSAFSYSTGSAQIDIPFYTLAGHELSIPIGLRYSGGSGIKLNEVGLVTDEMKERQKIAEKDIDSIDFGARLYSPVIRRWATPDPKSEDWYGISPYSYCAGDPVNFVDPDGKRHKVAIIGNHILISASYTISIPQTAKNQDEHKRLTEESLTIALNYWNNRTDEYTKNGEKYIIHYNLTYYPYQSVPGKYYDYSVANDYNFTKMTKTGDTNHTKKNNYRSSKLFNYKRAFNRAKYNWST